MNIGGHGDCLFLTVCVCTPEQATRPHRAMQHFGQRRQLRLQQRHAVVVNVEHDEEARRGNVQLAARLGERNDAPARVGDVDGARLDDLKDGAFTSSNTTTEQRWR